MPKINIASVPVRPGSGYPPPFDAPCATRTRQRVGDAGGLHDFGGNLMREPQTLTTCSDVDMKSANADGRFVHKDGTPY